MFPLVSGHHVGVPQRGVSILNIVQSLNSAFFPPLIGAEPGGEGGGSERRVQDNLHAHAQKAAIFFPQIGEKTIFGRTAFRVLKNMSIN